MPTVIDALVVTLGLQTKQFDEGSRKSRADLKKTREEAAKTAKHMEESGKTAAIFFSKLRSEALMFASTMAGFAGGVGLAAFAVSTIRSAASLDRMSQNLNISARSLEAWKLANKNAGGSAEGMAAQIKKAADDVAASKMGIFSDSMRGSVLWGGIDPGALTSGTDLLMRQSQKISDMYKKDPNKARFIAQQMGVSDDVFNLMKLGPAQMRQAMQAQAALADELAKSSDKAEILRKHFDSLGNTFRTTGTVVVEAFLPEIDAAGKQLKKFGDWVVLHKSDIREWVRDAIKWFGDLLKKLDDGAKSVGGWKNVLIALAGLKILSMVSPLLSLAAALANVGGALGLIGKAGPAALAILGGLWIARELGLPDTDSQKGHDDLANGDWLKASADLPAKQLTQASMVSLRGQATSPRAQRAFDMLVSAGYTPEQAAGVVGNLIQESGLNPTARNSKSGAYGIAQWLSADRRAAFKNMFGHDITQSTFNEQMRYLIAEMGPGGLRGKQGELVRQAKTVDQAAMLFMKHIEAPGDAEAKPWKRQVAGALVLANERKLQKQAGTPASGTLPLNAWNMVGPASGLVTGGNTASSTSTISINGPVTVTTNATDAKGVADGLRNYIQTNILAMQANTGLR